jgi:hypothetical protein
LIDFIYAEKGDHFPFSYRSKVAYPFFHRKKSFDYSSVDLDPAPLMI